MAFFSALPRAVRGHDEVWVIVGRLTKSTHFPPFKTGTTLDKLAGMYIAGIVRLHGVPVSVVSFLQGSSFLAECWKALHAAVGT